MRFLINGFWSYIWYKIALFDHACLLLACILAFLFLLVPFNIIKVVHKWKETYTSNVICGLRSSYTLLYSWHWQISMCTYWRWKTIRSVGTICKLISYLEVTPKTVKLDGLASGPTDGLSQRLNFFSVDFLSEKNEIFFWEIQSNFLLWGRGGGGGSDCSHCSFITELHNFIRSWYKCVTVLSNM